MPLDDPVPTYTMGALGRRVYDRVNDVLNVAMPVQNPAACAVEAYIDARPHPPEWRSAVDDCWRSVEDGLTATIVAAAEALAEVRMARREIRHAPG